MYDDRGIIKLTSEPCFLASSRYGVTLASAALGQRSRCYLVRTIPCFGQGRGFAVVFVDFLLLVHYSVVAEKMSQ